MRITALCLLLFVCTSSVAAPRATPSRAAYTQDGDFGLGLMVGTIVSATGKYWVSQNGAIDFGLGFSDHNTTVIYGDYLWHVPGIFGNGTRFGRETSGYIGGGAGLAFWTGDHDVCGRWKCDGYKSAGSGFFLRGLVGFEWHPSPTRFGVFAELGPSILITPRTEGSLDVGIGGRYYF